KSQTYFSDRSTIRNSMSSNFCHVLKNENINENINKKELSLFVLIAQSPNIKRKELLKIPSMSRSTIDRILKALSSAPLNLIEYQGSKKIGGYVLTDKGTAYYHSLNQ
ncbi:MAG: transcriptional regulator, partial [Bacteroides sp.]|nr:transcriptional regulator [Bacteroides sp.]